MFVARSLRCAASSTSSSSSSSSVALLPTGRMILPTTTRRSGAAAGRSTTTTTAAGSRRAGGGSLVAANLEPLRRHRRRFRTALTRPAPQPKVAFVALKGTGTTTTTSARPKSSTIEAAAAAAAATSSSSSFAQSPLFEGLASPALARATTGRPPSDVMMSSMELLTGGVLAFAATVSLIVGFPSSEYKTLGQPRQHLPWEYGAAGGRPPTPVGDGAWGWGGGNGNADGGEGSSISTKFGSFLHGTLPPFAAREGERQTRTTLAAATDERRQRQTPDDVVAATTTTNASTRTDMSSLPVTPAWLPSKMSDGSPYDVSVGAIRGCRLYMEDEYCVANGGRFVAVFDGHGGNAVSRMLKYQLYPAICRHLRRKHWEESSDLDNNNGGGRIEDSDADRNGRATTGRQGTANAIMSSYYHAAPKGDSPSSSSSFKPTVSTQVAALRSAYAEVEDRIMQDDSLAYQGSTAVAVVLHESEDGEHRSLLSANVGDSRAVLSRRGRAVDLTRDHKPNDEREKRRLLAMGESIEWDNLCKVHRVRNLSLSRAMGDRDAKPAVSAQVEIKHFPIARGEDEFVVLASDGLWDVMSSQDVVSFVHRKMRRELSREQIGKDDVKNLTLVLRRSMAKFVAREAIRRGTGDNVCVCMVWLSDLRNGSSSSSSSSSS